MKTLKAIRILSIILMAICMSAIVTFAGKPEIAPAVHIQKAIKDNITYPAKAVKNCCTGSVNVTFAITENGKIDIKKISTDNKEIAEEVKAQLAKIDYKEANAPSYQLYEITISFKLI
jgi:outer membrane biosynthesis protein TonB